LAGLKSGASGLDVRASLLNVSRQSGIGLLARSIRHIEGQGLGSVSPLPVDTLGRCEETLARYRTAVGDLLVNHKITISVASSFVRLLGFTFQPKSTTTGRFTHMTNNSP
jgi:hypothetical protein